MLSFVIKEIEENEGLVTKVIKYIKKILQNNETDFDDIFHSSSIDDTQNEDFQTDDLISDKLFRKEHLELISKIPELDYLKERLQKSLDERDYIEMRSVSLILFTFFKPSLSFDRLLMPMSPYKGHYNTNYWSVSANKILYEKIKNIALYESAQIYNFGILQLLPIIINFDFHNKITSLLLKEGILKKNQSENERKEDSIRINTILISCMIWFENLKEEKQIEILNSYHNFTIEEEKLNESIDDLGSKNLSDISEILLKSGYLIVSKNIFSYILSNCIKNNNSICQVSTLLHLTNIDYIFSNYKDVLVYSKQALKILEKEQKYEFLQAIMCLRVSESFFHLNNQEKMKIYLKIAENKSRKLKGKQLNAYNSQLIAFYSQTENYFKEYELLTEMLDPNNNSLPRYIEETIINRLTFMDGAFETSSQDFNKEKLKSSKNESKFYACYHRGRRLLLAFQYDRAFEWFEEALKYTNINNKPLILNQIISSLFRKGEYTEIEQYIEILNELNPQDSYNFLHLGIISYINELTEKAMSNFAKGIIKENENFKSTIRFVEPMIVYLLPYNISEKIDQIINKIAEKIKEDILLHDFYLNIGSVFGNYGYFEEGIKFMQLSLDYSQNDKQKAMTLNNFGYNFFNQKKYDEAIDKYHNAIELDAQNSQIWFNLALAQAQKQNFKKAIDALFEAKKHCKLKDKYFYDDYIRKYDLISKNYVNLNMIKNEKVKDMILSAESIILDHNPSKSSKSEFADMIDFSMIVVQYSKALERMLHDEISLNLWKHLEKKYDGYIDKELWNGNDQNTELPTHIRIFHNNLRKGRTFTLGNWCIALDLLKSTTTNPIEIDFTDFFLNNYSLEDISIIKNACCKLNEQRGVSAHFETEEREKVVTLRSEYIPHLNNVISILYKN